MHSKYSSSEFLITSVMLITSTMDSKIQNLTWQQMMKIFRKEKQKVDRKQGIYIILRVLRYIFVFHLKFLKAFVRQQ